MKLRRRRVRVIDVWRLDDEHVVYVLRRRFGRCEPLAVVSEPV